MTLGNCPWQTLNRCWLSTDSMRLAYADQAVAEVAEALAYYRAIDPLLSAKLVAEIDESIRLICAMPTAWKSAGDGLRQCRVKVFPYIVVYAVKKDVIAIVAFANTHRLPRYWQGRLT